MDSMPLSDDEEPLDEERTPANVGDAQHRKSRLLSQQCSTCIFRPGNPMHLSAARLREVINEARRHDSYIVCHSTLPGMGDPDTEPAICRGFADRYDTRSLRLIRALWGFLEVDPPGPRSH